MKVIINFEYITIRRLWDSYQQRKKLVLKCNKKAKENRMFYALNKRNNNILEGTLSCIKIMQDMKKLWLRLLILMTLK